MKLIFIPIDSIILGELSSKQKSAVLRGLKKWAMETGRSVALAGNHNNRKRARVSGVITYLISCPFCGRANLMDDSLFRKSGVTPSVCPFCGSMDPYARLVSNITNAGVLLTLERELPKAGLRHDEYSVSKWTRVLLEQATVSIATSIEVFMRDVYAILMNARYVQYGQTLYERFHKDGRGKFTNLDRGLSEFHRDLGIDLHTMLTEEEVSRLLLVSAKRNVIVHNSGIVDQQFLTQCKSKDIQNILSSLKQKPVLKRPVPITGKEGGRAIAITHKMAKKIAGITEAELLDRQIRSLLLVTGAI